MEESRKRAYEYPVTEVIGVKLEAVVCVSDEIPDFDFGGEFVF